MHGFKVRRVASTYTYDIFLSCRPVLFLHPAFATMELPSVLVLSLLTGLASVHAQTPTAEPCAAVSSIAAAQATGSPTLDANRCLLTLGHR